MLSSANASKLGKVYWKLSVQPLCLQQRQYYLLDRKKHLKNRPDKTAYLYDPQHRKLYLKQQGKIRYLHLSDLSTYKKKKGMTVFFSLGGTESLTIIFQGNSAAQDVAAWVNKQILYDYNSSSWYEVWESRLKVSWITDGPAGLFWWVTMVMWIWPYLSLMLHPPQMHSLTIWT